MRRLGNWCVRPRIALRLILLSLAGFGVMMLLPHRPAVHAQQAMTDTDGDGVPDAIDNCVLVPNPDQRDTNGNGFGNACDGDLNGDGVVNSIDFSILKARLFTSDPGADLNGDGIVNSIDFSIMKTLLLKPLGPSCCGAAAAPDVSVPKKPEPPPASVDTFLVTGTVPGQIPGKNGVMCQTFTPAAIQQFNLGSTVVVTPGGNGDVLNDLGMSPDQKAGDGVYCGFTKLDPSQTPAQQSADIQTFTNRVTALGGVTLQSLAVAPQAAVTVPNVNIGIFNARALTDTASQFTFTVSTPAPPLANLAGFPIFTAPTLPPALCNEDRCLTITDLSVVADPTRTFDVCNTNGRGNNVNPNAAWAFKTLLSNMANTPVTGVSAQVFIHAWLSRWLTNQTALNTDGSANALAIPNRATGINTFLTNGTDLPGWNPNDPSTLDLNQLPFRLLAIVYRPDLPTSGLYGSSNVPSEIRFVFGLIDRASCQPNSAGFAVIFEYADQTTCTGLKNRANQFISLDTGNPAFPSASYNAALQAITDNVTKVNAVPTRANGSALNQARTNEVTFGLFSSGPPWELRQFDINASSHQLMPNSINQTPDVSLNGSARLRDCINDPSFLNPCGANVPINWEPSSPAGPFLGPSIDYLSTFFFNAPGVTPSNRWNFSANTCGGCHGADRLNPSVTFGPGGLNIVAPAGPFPSSFTGAPESFYHVDPRTPGGARARLSRFVKGTNVLAPHTPISDPAGSGMTMNFYDLQRRNQIMATQSVSGCLIGPRVDGFLAQTSLAIVH
jgi:hypothetical protein